MTALDLPRSGNGTVDVILYVLAAGLLLFVGYWAGRILSSLSSAKVIRQKEQELFTTQRGFKNLYDQELTALKAENARLEEQAKTLTARVEDYRRKAAGYGGLFN